MIKDIDIFGFVLLLIVVSAILERVFADEKFPIFDEIEGDYMEPEKEVYFDQYCKTCVRANSPDTDKKCDECLGSPTNAYSHKPVNWERKE